MVKCEKIFEKVKPGDKLEIFYIFIVWGNLLELFHCFSMRIFCFPKLKKNKILQQTTNTSNDKSHNKHGDKFFLERKFLLPIKRKKLPCLGF